ncbi:MAG: alpha/beta hydrolase [Agarilytica sp.]
MENKDNEVSFETHKVTCINLMGTHEIACNVYPGAPDKTVLCLHGFTRNRFDFHFLAQFLASHGWRVITMDFVGRGESTYFGDPHRYVAAQNWCDIQRVLYHFKVTELHIIGTSFGGWQSIFSAVNPALNVTSIILNDVGPSLSYDMVHAINDYSSEHMQFDSIDDVEAELRTRYGGSTVSTWNLQESQWRHFAEHSARKLENGKYSLAYDTALVKGLGYEYNHQAYDMWNVWEQVKCPTFVFRGELSDIFTHDSLARMQETGPSDFSSMTISNAGHHPMLSSEAEETAILDWLNRHN